MNLQLRIRPIFLILILLPSLLIVVQAMFYNSYFVLPGKIDHPEPCHTLILNIKNVNITSALI